MRALGFRIFLGMFLTFLLLAVAMEVNGEWLLTEGVEEMVLTRVDNSSTTPYHEVDAGKYVYEPVAGEFVTVLDFNTTQVIQSPFGWSQVQWVPGPLDADSTQTQQ